mgnify:CR=1 FL=1
MATFSIAELADACRTNQEAIRYSLNSCGIPQLPDGTVNFPDDRELLHRFLHIMVTRPRNAAQRILFDLKRGIF